jgi:uncharacterized membrane protein
MLTSLIDKQFVKQPKRRIVSEYPIRSLAKALSWRVTGSTDTLVLSWLFTSNLTIAAAISLTEVLTKLVLYYLHERVWNRIPLGKGAPTILETAPQATFVKLFGGAFLSGNVTTNQADSLSSTLSD